MKWLRRKTKSLDSPSSEKTTDVSTDNSSDNGNRDDSEKAPDSSPPKAVRDTVDQNVDNIATDLPEAEAGGHAAREDLAKITSAISVDVDPSVYPKGLRLTIIIASLCFSVFLVALDQTIIATAMYTLHIRFLLLVRE